MRKSILTASLLSLLVAAGSGHARPLSSTEPAAASAPAKADRVGFQELTIANGEDKPLAIGVWYPTNAAERPMHLRPFIQSVATDGAVAGSGLPLVVFSHGTGGWYAGVTMTPRSPWRGQVSSWLRSAIRATPMTITAGRRCSGAAPPRFTA